MRGEKGEKRKQELLRIAYQMFIQKGYEATSIDDIIAEAHIAKGTYYYYFPSNFDIDIYKGDFTVIMGASGAGKSTLMYSLSGMDTPNAGTISFCGTEITGMNSDELAVFRRKNCGFVFQQIYLIDKMNLLDNVITAVILNTALVLLFQTGDAYDELSDDIEKADDINAYIPLYLSALGGYETGKNIRYVIDGKEYCFMVNGVISEMQYGNYGTGFIGLYLSEYL